jgi:hypothetical protein
MGETVRCWLVEREYDDRGLLRLVYATPGGSRHLRRERSAAIGGEVTAAVEVEEDRLHPVEDGELRERYAAEVDRVRARHEPDDPI